MHPTDFKEGYATKRAMTPSTFAPLLTRPILPHPLRFLGVKHIAQVSQAGEARRGEDNCRVLRGDRAESGQWDGPNHAVSFLHTLDVRTDIAHDNATMRCGGGEDVLCYGANKARGDALRSLQYTRT